MSNGPFPVHVGWDSRENIAFQVCRHWTLKHASVPLDLRSLRQQELRARGGP